MSKSAIYTVNTTPTTVEPTNNIPLGATIRRFGCNAYQNENTIQIRGNGYYLVTVTATISPTLAGNVGVSMLKNGTLVPGATASGTVATANDIITLPITAIIRNNHECETSAISFVLDTTASSVTNFAVEIVKL